MSKQLVLDLKDATYDVLVRMAARSGDGPEQQAAVLLELFTRTSQPGQNGVPVSGPGKIETVPPVDVTDPSACPKRGLSRRYFGSCSVGHPRGLDNEKIDEDQAEECGRGLPPRGK